MRIFFGRKSGEAPLHSARDWTDENDGDADPPIAADGEQSHRALVQR